ncbi:MAG: ATP-dependent protease LonB, partial [Thermoplasmata archaeon]|nr:ATP-dependent protease LonB [Thermoplasmata archaeon]
ASISVATAVFSAMEGIEVNQKVGMTGSLSVRGKVLPVGGVTAKIEAAAEMGLTKVIIPKSNLKDVILEDRYVGKIEIVPVETISEVLEHALLIGPEKDGLLKRLATTIAPAKGIGKADTTPA